MKKIISVLFITFAFVLSAYSQVDGTTPKGEVQIIDNFENGNYWIWAGFDWERYNGHKASQGCRLTRQHATEGKYAMELLVEPVKYNSNAVWFYDGTQDLSGGKYIVMDIYNPTNVEIEISFVLQATDKWEWLETQKQTIPPGQHKVVFNVSKLNKNFNDVRRINVNAFYKGVYDKESSLFIDNIILIK